jgi:hypothetical protein
MRPTAWTRRSTSCCEHAGGADVVRRRRPRPGQFFGVHNLATDSKGNLYTTETYTGARVQRFIFKGVGPVTKANQGVVWPERR